MSVATVDTRKDVLLLLLFSPGVDDQPNEPIEGRTRLVKMLYLFKKEVLADFRKGTSINEENFYEFFPWDFGPFSREVYDDLMFFSLRGFIDSDSAAKEQALPESEAEWEEWFSSIGAVSDEESSDEYREECFKLSETGERFTAPMYESLGGNQKTLLREFKRRTTRVPLRALLRYVYQKYPDDTTHSKIKEDVLGRYWH